MSLAFDAETRRDTILHILLYICKNEMPRTVKGLLLTLHIARIAGTGNTHCYRHTTV